MANGSIYDVAKIAAGDPIGGAIETSKVAATKLAQFKHKKEIIEAINEAIEDAERKAKKDKGFAGLGGSLLGALLGTGLTMIPGLGVAAPALMQAMGAGLGAAGAEKFRQDKYDPTKKLAELEKELGKRKEVTGPGGVTETKENIEQNLDQMITDDALTSFMMAYIMPGIEKGFEARVPGSKEVIGQGDVLLEDLENITDLTSIEDISFGESLADISDITGLTVEDIAEGTSLPGYAGESVAGDVYKKAATGAVDPSFDIDAINELNRQFGFNPDELVLDPEGVSQYGFSTQPEYTPITSDGVSLATDADVLGLADEYRAQGYNYITDEVGGSGWYRPEITSSTETITDFADIPGGGIEEVSYTSGGDIIQNENWIPDEGKIDEMIAGGERIDARFTQDYATTPAQYQRSGFDTGYELPESIGEQFDVTNQLSEKGYLDTAETEVYYPREQEITTRIGQGVDYDIPIPEPEIAAIPEKHYLKGFFGEKIPMTAKQYSKLGPMGGPDILSSLVGKWSPLLGEGLAGQATSFLQQPWLQKAARVLGPSILDALGPQGIAPQSKFSMPDFVNPYRTSHWG